MEGSSPTIYGGNNFKYYVWNAHQTTTQSEKLYIEGPAAISMDGSPVNIKKMADEAIAYINSHSTPVFLIGWSRGAAACIQVALNLSRTRGKSIEAMFLFDAVDQDTSTDDFLNYIPSNVQNCYHAIATDKSWMDRQLFPTCGQYAASSVNFKKGWFHATHGGIAGAGDTDGGSKKWMWNYMKSHGVV